MGLGGCSYKMPSPIVRLHVRQRFVIRGEYGTKYLTGDIIVTSFT